MHAFVRVTLVPFSSLWAAFTMCTYSRVHTGSGSVPDSSEPGIGFAFTSLRTDPTRTLRVRFAVYTLRLFRDRFMTIRGT